MEIGQLNSMKFDLIEAEIGGQLRRVIRTTVRYTEAGSQVAHATPPFVMLLDVAENLGRQLLEFADRARRMSPPSSGQAH